MTRLYLAKDTVHRWFTRVSSPLARVLVVYSLTLSALAALGGYVISVNVVRDNIINSGANVVSATMSSDGDADVFVPSKKDIESIVDADSFLFYRVGSAYLSDQSSANVYVCDFSRLNDVAPYLPPNGMPTLLQPKSKERAKPGPADARIGDTEVSIFVRSLPDDSPLMLAMKEGMLIVQREDIERLNIKSSFSFFTLAIAVRNLENASQIRQVESFIESYMKLEHLSGYIISALKFMEELDNVLSHQTECRVAVCLIITIIVGILLTALAGMEYRQNEYIYTLMKSFGIHPFLLVGSFIVENIILVGASFAAAITTFMFMQGPIVTQVLKLGNYSVSLQEIMPEIMLISYILIGCVFISALPIFAAAGRRIGRVLK